MRPDEASAVWKGGALPEGRSTLCCSSMTARGCPWPCRLRGMGRTLSRVGVSHREPVGDRLHLDPVRERRARADRRRDLEGLGHLLEVRAVLEAGPGVGIDAVWAL